MLSRKEKLLVDRYLDNTLTGTELSDFLSRLENDEAFKKDVSFHNKLVEGINEAEDQRLMQFVMEATGYRKRLVPLSLKLIITFLIVTGGGIILWEYIGPGSTGEKHDYFSWSFSSRGKKMPSKNENAETVTTTESSQKKIQQPIVQVEGNKTPPEVKDTFSGPEIIVKKDQLLVTYSLQPIELETGNSSSADVPIEKADPEAGLPDNKIRKYEVEFWASPVNYRGYKLQGGKLILFGIEAPDEVQLYSIGEKLWLKYGSDFFEIQSNNDFESLVEANAIPTELK